MYWPEVKRLESSNENVWKYVFESPKAVAEAVLYRYPSFEERTVICCSTMSGCPVGCRFCGAGDYFVRSLSSQEIVEQVQRCIKDAEAAEGISFQRIKRLQVMFMSMGEPMLNWVQLSKALGTLSILYSNARLLISTSGPRAPLAYSQLRELSKEIPQIGLQFSVHESTDEARAKLIPYENKLSLSEIAAEGQWWAEATGRRPFFNYCVHEGNDTQEDVDRLVALFSPETWEATLSVICERDEHIAAANERQRRLTSDFMQKMLSAGYSTRMFDPAGQDDIGGGCGQLWFVQDWMKKNPTLAKPSCGNGMEKVHTPSMGV